VCVCLSVYLSVSAITVEAFFTGARYGKKLGRLYSDALRRPGVI